MTIRRLLKRVRTLRWLNEIRWRFIGFTNNENPVGIIRGLLIEGYYYASAKFGKSRGIATTKRTPTVVISLASIQTRLPTLCLCIESLLRQEVRPDHLILWLPASIDEDQIPRILLGQALRGLQIRSCKEIGPFKKLFYALKEFPDSIIVTCDDDTIYPKDWLKKLYESYERDPKHIYCYTARFVGKDGRGTTGSYVDWPCIEREEGPSLQIFPVGVGGVLYPPNSLNKEVLNEELYLRLCPKGDDIWLKAMSLLQGTLCKRIALSRNKQHQIFGTQQVSLWSENQRENDGAIGKVFDHYGLHDLLDSAI